MKILVTGSDGQLGSDLVPLLAREGHDAAGADITGSGASSLDITDREKTISSVVRLRPEVIINCAAYTAVDRAEKEIDAALAVNRDGPANLADAAGEIQALLIHISTDFVFNGSRNLPYDESQAADPLGVYGKTKLLGEQEVAKRLPGHIIVRTSWLYGTHGHNFVKTILRHAGEREALRVVYDQAGTPTSSFDLAGALTVMVNRYASGSAPYGTYHYSNEGVASWYDFAVRIIEGAGRLGAKLRCARVEPILTGEYPTPAKRPAYSVLDKKKVKETFGVSIPHWQDSLEKTLNELYGGGKVA
ncbi:MAG: dTDP-4-dehydrorhamnose reductase [Deltaproteobacteria bacterium]|nr:dTDP-4-dehydrorhamnose reductase [Deltaproteobacteria bacterium]